METFSYQDIEDYYDQTEIHYKMWWNLEKSLGLHYGVWDKTTKNLAEAVANLNRLLSQLADLKPAYRVIDAGCGIGGSSFYLAESLACTTTGVTLSQKQVETARKYAVQKGLEDQCSFIRCSYTDTPFEDGFFDICWAIESLGSADKKELFFREMRRILKPDGKILIADTFKSHSFSIEENKLLKAMLNPWAISDILSTDELIELAEAYGFRLIAQSDVTAQIKKSVNKMYFASLAGMIGTKLYNLYRNASRFSKIHYKSGIAQKKAYEKGDWKYVLFAFERTE